MVATFCVAGVAMGMPPIKPDDIAGRWVSDKESTSRKDRLTLDVSRCGNGWCGVEVKHGSTCGRIALRLDQGRQDDGFIVDFDGRIELAPGTQPYAVRAELHTYRGAFRIMMYGNSGDELQLWRRNFPFQHLLSRSGDAVCPPDAKVS
jgi:hypothetical protein